MGPSHSPRALAQIALAEQALGRWVEAERDLRNVLHMSEDPSIARNRDTAQRAGGDGEDTSGGFW